MDNDNIIGVADAAKLAGVTRAAVYLWIAEGRVKPVDTGSSRMELRAGDVLQAKAQPEGRTPSPAVATRVKARRRRILALCRKNARITIAAITAAVGATDGTIRADIRALRGTGGLTGDPGRGWVVGG